MKKRKKDKKIEWHKPAYTSLKFSQTLGGDKLQWIESVTHGANHGGSTAG